MVDFKLSASLEGHDDDVRAVAFPSPDFALSASRDATVRIWKNQSKTPPVYDGTIVSHGQAFVNTVAYLRPSNEYPNGLIISGGKDAIVEARSPSGTPEENAEALMIGHANNVCALDVSPSSQFIVSGAWDSQARVWTVGKWSTSTVLEGHTASVWAVLVYDDSTIITGCADKLIRVFRVDGRLIRTIRGSSDVVRALCKLPDAHPTGAQFASAGNDNVVRLWTLEGVEIGQMLGHENFIYSLGCLPSGEIVSSSEDRTVRIWKGVDCIQTITHPAISVWSVAVCAKTGDIISGASDKTVRIFSRSSDRQAPEEVISAFEEAVRNSAIPQQALGGGSGSDSINKEKLPGPQYLTEKSGTKEGQVQMIREPNGSISAHQWSSAANQWINVGTVVDAVGSSGRKITHNNRDYDYVFDVDIEDGKPPLKLPYNLNQNPYEAARSFIEDNELPVGYLDQVANFIVSNTQGASLGQSPNVPPQAPGSDPWGSESRYRPGEVGAPAPSDQPAASRPKMLPQTQYLSIVNANISTILSKIMQLNESLVNEGSKDLSLGPDDMSSLKEAAGALEKTRPEADALDQKHQDVIARAAPVILRMITEWPEAMRLPGLDLLRLVAASGPALVQASSAGLQTIVDILSSSGVLADADRPNNIMLATRVLANLFSAEEGRMIMDGELDKVLELLRPIGANKELAKNRNLAIALATLYINYAVLTLNTPSSANITKQAIARGLTLMTNVLTLAQAATDSEALYRGLVAVGTLVCAGEDFRVAVKKEKPHLQKVLSNVESKSKEPRIKGIMAEIRDELH